MYAQWKANTYNVTYDSQLGSAVAKASWNFGSSLTLPAAPFRSGWTFKGWFPAATGGTALANGSTPSNTADFTLYAQWTANTLTVTYNSQSGSAVANGTCMTGSTLTLPAAPTRAGYTFSGWFTSPTGGTALVSGFSPSFIANFTLYAQWIAKTVNVTFNSQSGSAVASSTFTVGSTLTLPAEPTRSGYGFNGWFTAATGGTSVNSGYSPTNTADFTLYAQWNKSSEKPAGVSIANITFASGSSDLVAATRSILDSAIKEIIKNKKTTINLAGFTDSKGSAAANLILSKNRAVTVQKYLEKGLKSYKVKFNLSYYGSAKSVGTSAAAQALSRRVEIFVK